MGRGAKSERIKKCMKHERFLITYFFLQQRVNETQNGLIKKLNADYDCTNLCMPNGLCNSCRSKLNRSLEKVEKPDYLTIFSNGAQKWTRELEKNVDSCTCKLCYIAGSRGGHIKKWKKVR